MFQQWAQKNLTVDGFRKFRIPVSLLEVRRVIVDILGNFPKLRAESEARQRRYEYYRDKLLAFKEAA